MEGPRNLKAREFKSLCTLVNTVFRGDGVGRMEEQYPLLFAPENYDHLLVMVDDGVVVSHVGALTRDISVLGCRMPTMSIGAVATYESHRGQGLATRLMEAAIRKAVEQDAVLMPISGGRGLYTRLGARRIGQYVLYTVPRDLLPGCEVDIRRAEAEDLLEMTRLYAEEPSRYVRSTNDLRMAVDVEWICDRDGETVVIRDGGRPVAYAGIQKRRPDREGEASRARLCEIAGSRFALVRALPDFYERFEVDCIEIVTTSSDRELASLLRPHGVTAAPQGFTGTVLVLQPERLLRAFDEYIADVLGAGTLTWEVSADSAVFRCGGKDHAVASSDLGALVFGVVPPDEDPFETFPAGLLRTAVENVFPVQLPWYGFNFV
ncbi:MAG: GNAT family N-acetyltransferase [Gemmatimonadetes bacterium]|nr:GNAT family N-acetyltransferase [Gemmatimonadota bacterium]